MKDHHRFEAKVTPGMSIQKGAVPTISLVRGGKRAYLWIGDESKCYAYLSGPQTLRKLARAILAEVPAAKR